MPLSIDNSAALHGSHSCGQLCSGAPGPPYSHLTVFINSLKFKESCWGKAVCKQGFPLCSHWRVSHTAGGCTVCVCGQMGERPLLIESVTSVCVFLCRKNIPFSILMSEQNVPISVKFTSLLRGCLWWHLVYHSEFLIPKQIQKQSGYKIQVILTPCWVYPDCQSFQ